jgi:hypothetical protein
LKKRVVTALLCVPSVTSQVEHLFLRLSWELFC